MRIHLPGCQNFWNILTGEMFITDEGLIEKVLIRRTTEVSYEFRFGSIRR